VWEIVRVVVAGVQTFKTKITWHSRRRRPVVSQPPQPPRGVGTRNADECREAAVAAGTIALRLCTPGSW